MATYRTAAAAIVATPAGVTSPTVTTAIVAATAAAAAAAAPGVEDGVVGRLLVVRCVPDEGVAAANPAVRVGEAPGRDADAPTDLQAGLDDVAVVCRLLGELAGATAGSDVLQKEIKGSKSQINPNLGQISEQPGRE